MADDDPDDEVWDGPPVGGAPTPSPTPAVEVSISKRKDCPLPPYCEWYAPSETRKRPKGKVLQLVPFDLSVRPDPADGRWRCKTCPSSYDTRTLLFGHARFCEGQEVWQCEWCQCRESETHHKANGPSGAKTLCSACSARYRAGHNGLPTQNDKGEWICDKCLRGFPTMSSLGGHKRFCDGGIWQCAWCHCKADECQNKSLGPDGPATLCSACSQRFRSGHTGPPAQDVNGKFVCEDCGRTFDNISGLGSHRARCDGGVWRCGWCSCKYEETTGKGPGPAGAKTLCSTCSARFRGGATGPPTKNEDGKFVCETCDRTFETISGLGSHRARCDGGVWRCEWCSCKYEASNGKGPGPNGAKTLCSACSGRFRGGATGPPTKNEDGKFVCETCDRTFETISALGSHRHRCDGGKWRCDWCQCKADETTGKGPGPAGASTLCANCAGRYRSGASGAAKRDAQGNYICDCGRLFSTNAGLGGHRRRCNVALAVHGGDALAIGAMPLIIGEAALSPMGAPSPTPSGTAEAEIVFETEVVD